MFRGPRVPQGAGEGRRGRGGTGDVGGACGPSPTSYERPEHRGEEGPRAHHGSGTSGDSWASSYLRPGPTPPHRSSTERSKPPRAFPPTGPWLPRGRLRPRAPACSGSAREAGRALGRGAPPPGACVVAERCRRRAFSTSLRVPCSRALALLGTAM